MESLTETRKFMSAARAFARSKPIIVLKAGASREGASVAESHVGMLSGNDLFYDAAFKRAGIVRVKRIGQLFNCAQAFSMQKRPKGNRLAIITNSGAAGILAIDYLVENGGTLAQLSDKTLEELKKALPSNWSAGNPIDVLGEATPEEYAAALQACAVDNNVDGILLMLTPPQYGSNSTEVAKAVAQITRKVKKTVLAVWMGEDAVEAGRELLEQANVPVYRYPEDAVDVFIKMYEYNYALDLLYEMPPNIPENFTPDRIKVQQILDDVMAEGRQQLTEYETKQILDCYYIPSPKSQLVHSLADAKAAAATIGFPVVMKISSSKLMHKTEIGGLILDIKSVEGVAAAYKQLYPKLEQSETIAERAGILIEQMTPKSYELFIGAKHDPQFGPIILFGKGGGTVNIFNDIGAGLVPLNMTLAKRIIEQTKSYRILKGYKAYPPTDIEELQFTLCKFSYLMMDFPELAEIDVNPFGLDEQSGVVLDGYAQLQAVPNKTPYNRYQHLVVSPYPTQYVKSVTLKNGRVVLFRPIRPEDEPLEAELMEDLSENTLYFRFFGYAPKVTHENLSRFTHIDYDREMAIVAEIEQSGKKRLAGVVRIIADAWNEAAEYAIVVADDFQGFGLGSLLTEYIIVIAKAQGIQKVYASVLASNKRMLRMFEHRGFTLRQEDFRVFYVEKGV